MTRYFHEIGLLEEVEAGLRDDLANHPDWGRYLQRLSPTERLGGDRRFIAWRQLCETIEAVRELATASRELNRGTALAATGAIDAAPAAPQSSSPALGEAGAPAAPNAEHRVVPGQEPATVISRERPVIRLLGARKLSPPRADLHRDMARVTSVEVVPRTAAAEVAVPTSPPPIPNDALAAIEPFWRDDARDSRDVLPSDPLTLIRGIDATLAQRLNGIGIQAFAQIASWTRADINRIAGLLGLGRRIERENWIEQSAFHLIARGQHVPAPGALDHRSSGLASAPSKRPQLTSSAASAMFDQAGSEPAQAPGKTAIETAPPHPAGQRATSQAQLRRRRRRPAERFVQPHAAVGLVRRAQAAGTVNSPDDLETPLEHALGATVRAPEAGAETPAAQAQAQAQAQAENTDAPPSASEPQPQTFDFSHVKGLSADGKLALMASAIMTLSHLSQLSAREAQILRTLLPPDTARRLMGWVEQATLLARQIPTVHALQQQSGLDRTIVPRPVSRAWTPRLIDPTPALREDQREAAPSLTERVAGLRQAYREVAGRDFEMPAEAGSGAAGMEAPAGLGADGATLRPAPAPHGFDPAPTAAGHRDDRWTSGPRDARLGEYDDRYETAGNEEAGDDETGTSVRIVRRNRPDGAEGRPTHRTGPRSQMRAGAAGDVDEPEPAYPTETPLRQRISARLSRVREPESGQRLRPNYAVKPEEAAVQIVRRQSAPSGAAQAAAENSSSSLPEDGRQELAEPSLLDRPYAATRDYRPARRVDRDTTDGAGLAKYLRALTGDRKKP
ncbi:MAG: hypothetical protein ACFCUN_11725 [Hyphomicrobiaceae bacterium]